MAKQENYKSIFKSTGLFAGVQVITILFSVIKTKVVAILLGTQGFGIISIFNSTTTLISSISNLGIQTSAVREIASANTELEISNKIAVTNKLALITSVIGTIITIVLSPFLSRWFFHNSEYTLPFILLSSVILFTGLYNQCYAILQGLRKLRYLAISSILSAFIGLIISIPLYCIFKEEGIVWSLILTALSTLLIGYIYVKKTAIIYYDASIKQSFREGLPVIKLGVFIALSNNVAYLVQFLLKAFISNITNVSEVGLFQAGWSLNTMYVGMIFTAMSKDYYPRLCININNNSGLKELMNEQSEIGLLLLAPMVVLMITFIDPVLRILYSSEFMPVAPMTILLLLGTLIQVVSWALGYVFLAKNDGKLYFFNEVGTKILMLPIYIIGYMIHGLIGLGITFIINQVIYLLWIGIVAYKRYNITYNLSCIKLFCIFFSSTTLFIYLRYFVLQNLLLTYFFASCIILYSLIQLNQRINLSGILKRFWKQKSNSPK